MLVDVIDIVTQFVDNGLLGSTVPWTSYGVLDGVGYMVGIDFTGLRNRWREEQGLAMVQQGSEDPERVSFSRTFYFV